MGLRNSNLDEMTKDLEGKNSSLSSIKKVNGVNKFLKSLAFVARMGRATVASRASFQVNTGGLEFNTNRVVSDIKDNYKLVKTNQRWEKYNCTRVYTEKPIYETIETLVPKNSRRGQQVMQESSTSRTFSGGAGAVVGGIIGSFIGKGNGQLVAVGIGTLIGNASGKAIYDNNSDSGRVNPNTEYVRQTKQVITGTEKVRTGEKCDQRFAYDSKKVYIDSNLLLEFINESGQKTGQLKIKLNNEKYDAKFLDNELIHLQVQNNRGEINHLNKNQLNNLKTKPNPNLGNQISFN